MELKFWTFVWLSLIRGTIWNGYSAYCDRVLKCTVLYKSVSTVRVHSVDTTTHDSDTMFITVTTLSPVQALVRCPLRAVRLLWALILFSHIRRSYDPLYLLYKKKQKTPYCTVGHQHSPSLVCRNKQSTYENLYLSLFTFIINNFSIPVLFQTLKLRWFARNQCQENPEFSQFGTERYIIPYM